MDTPASDHSMDKIDSDDGRPTARVEFRDDQQMSYVRRYVTVAILCLVNLLNYMDRSTIAGKRLIRR